MTRKHGGGIRSEWALPHTPRAQRRAGRLLVMASALGLVTALIGAIVSWQLIGQIDRATRDSLELTLSTLDTLEDTMILAESVLTGTTATLADVEDVLRSVAESLADSEALLNDVATLSATVAPAIERTVGTLRQLQDVGAEIDVLLGALGNLPLAPGYDPGRGLGPTFGAIASDLEPLPPVLKETGKDLNDAQANADKLQERLRAVETSIASVNDALAGSDQLLAQYRTNIELARSVTEDTRRELRIDATLGRLVLIAAALTFGLGQLVPFWIGQTYLDQARRTPSTPHHDA